MGIPIYVGCHKFIFYRHLYIYINYLFYTNYNHVPTYLGIIKLLFE